MYSLDRLATRTISGCCLILHSTTVPGRFTVSLCVLLVSDGKSVLPYFFRDSAARLLVNESLHVSLKLSAGGRVWLIHVSGNLQLVHVDLYHNITHDY